MGRMPPTAWTSKTAPRNPKGRKGRPATIGAQVRRMILQALKAEGGPEYLRWAARKEPAAFLALLGRLLPRDAAKLEEADAGGLAIIVVSGLEGGPGERPLTLEAEVIGPARTETLETLEPVTRGNGALDDVITGLE